MWRAVSGELPAAERRDVVDRMASRAGRRRSVASRARAQTRSDGGRASSSVRIIRAIVDARLDRACCPARLVRRRRAWCNSGARPRTLFATRADMSSSRSWRPMPRFRATPSCLRWKPGPEGSRYQVRVTTEDLRVLTTAVDLTAPELTIPREGLSDVAPNTRVLWQVVVALPGGETVSSSDLRRPRTMKQPEERAVRLRSIRKAWQEDVQDYHNRVGAVAGRSHRGCRR